MTKILLVDCLNPKNELETRYPCLGLGYLASFLKSKFGGQVKIKIINHDFEKELIQFKPDFVGLHCVSQNYNLAKEYAKVAKAACFAGGQSSLPVIIGGIHITSLPQSLTKNMDAAVLGEGEMTFFKLIKNWPKIKNLPGIAYWQKNKLKINPAAALIVNLDSLPFPDRRLLKIRPHSYLFTSRGCPFKCRFCASTRFWQKVRFFSAEYVATEIEELIKKYQVKFISFYDDLFIANLPRLEKLISLLEKKKINHKVKFSCNCRADLVTDYSAQLLAKLGIKSVGLGLESGDDQTLKFLKGPTASVVKNHQAIKILHRHHILANASFVIGSPQESKRQILKTLDFIKKSDLDFVDTYLLTPFPGTPVWDYAKKRKLVSENMDWNLLNISQPEKAIILSEKLSRKELLELYQLFQKEHWRIALKKFWKQPYFIDLPRYLYYSLKKWLLFSLGP